MNRRDALRDLFRPQPRASSRVVNIAAIDTGLEPLATPLTREEVYHLLRRMGFGPTHERVAQLVGRSAQNVVDELLGVGDENDTATPGGWVNAGEENPWEADLQNRFRILNLWAANWAALNNWWMGRMVADNNAIEKLTLFWSSHFITEFSYDELYSPPQTLFKQYQMFRKDRLGDFQKLVLDVTLDNAMVGYLGGTYNDAGRPNENYARELMELFTTGLGWYTEGDIKEAARVLTGWKISFFSDKPAPNGLHNTWFDPSKHDTGAKQVLGQTVPARTADNNTEFQVKTEEVQRLIEIIHTQRPEAVSRFIANKVYRFYVYSSPEDTSPAIVDQLAQVFRNGGFNIRTMLRTLFASAHFFDPALRGVQIKTPVEFVAGLLRQLGTTASNPHASTVRMDQAVFDAPNVAGWPGYHYWISTNSYPVRQQFMRDAVQAMSDSALQTFVKKFENYTDFDPFVRNVELYFLPVAVSQERHDFYVKALLGTAPDYEWPTIVNNTAACAQRMRSLLNTLAKAPDFQLC
jgi:uncharacterized protein (DUF1800 family)